MNRREYFATSCGLSVLGLGISLNGPISQIAAPALDDWLTLVLLVLLAILTEFFKPVSFRRNNQTPSPVIIFFFAGILLLPPALFVLLVLVAHGIEWATEVLSKTRSQQWYAPPFSIVSFIISGLAAGALNAIVNPNLVPSLSPISVIGMAPAAAAFVVLNRMIMALAELATGVSPSFVGRLKHSPAVISDLVMACFGIAFAMLWKINPWLSLPALAQLLLIYWVLEIPQLRRQARTDEKTGLWNARYFDALFTAEMNRAMRFERPMAIIMADLDLMRDINNSYGHMSGDAVLAAIGQAIRQALREYDIAARFGGEEFAIMLPETEQPKAYAIADRIRQAIASAPLLVPTSRTPIHATMSFGVASYPQDGATPGALMQHADAALYQAKVRGRNLVVAAAELPGELLRERYITRGRAEATEGKATFPDSTDSAPLSHRLEPEIEVIPGRRLDFSPFGPFARFRSGLAALAGFLMACLILAAVAALISGGVLNALPGDSLYPVKIAFETGRLAAASTDDDKAHLYLDFSRLRVDELCKTVKKRNAYQLPYLVGGYEHDVATATQLLALVAQQDPDRGFGLASDEVAALSQITKQLTPLLTATPGENKHLIQEAISLSLQNLAIAQEQLDATANTLISATPPSVQAATETPSAVNPLTGTAASTVTIQTPTPTPSISP